MSSSILWVSSLFVALTLILMPAMTVGANIKKFILFTDADDKSTRYVPLDSNSFVPISLFKHLGNHRPVAVDYDYVEGRVYWSDSYQGRIRSAFFDATSVKTLFRCNVKKPEGLAIDYVGRNIYWTDTGTNRIEVGSLDGTGRKLLIKDGLDEPRAIVLHFKNSMMYWTDWGANPKIERAGMDGSARQTIVTGNLGWPNGLTIDLATDRLYWADAKLNKIEKSDLNGGNRQLIMSSAANIHPFGLAIFENVLYWTDWSAKSISRFNLSSGNQQIIVKGLQKPMDIHVFDPALIFSGFHPCAQNNGLCSDLCLLKPGGNGTYQCACPTGIQLKADGKTCDYGLFYKTTSDQFMIFAESDYKGGIYKVPLGVPETPCYPLGINANISSPVAVDYDPVEGKIYWSDVDLKLLARAFLDGSSVEVIAYSHVVIPAGLAVDYVGRHIYWTDEGNNRIEVARLNGSSRRSLITSNIEEPRAILLDIGERKMYWGGRRASAKIEQANLDGSGRKVLVDHGVKWVNALAMDYQNRLLYWCDAYLDKIERVDLQGNNREVILDLSLDSMRHPFGLALFGDVLYWSDWNSKSLHQYNMRTSVQSVVVSGMGKPMELHIYDRSKDFTAVTCPALLSPPNGLRQGCTGTSTESYSTVCLFSCGTGFNPVGSLSRKCLENGHWSGQDFLCQAVTCVPLRIPPRALLQNGSCGNTYGSSCEFGCQSGYVQADGNVTRTCLETGHWSGIPIYCIETKKERVILEHTSSLTIAMGSSFAVTTFILVCLLALRKRHFLIRKWRRLTGRENVEENNPVYDEMDGNQNDVEQANDGFQNPRNQSGRRRNDRREENVGLDNGAYVDRDGNQNSVARAEETELNVMGSQNTAERGQNDAVSSDTGGTAGSSAMYEGGSDEHPVTNKHCLCIHELVGVSWKKVLRNLSMDDTAIRNLEEDYKHCEVAEKCYQGLLKWTKIVGPEKATTKKLCYVLQKVGCLKGLEALRNMPHQSDS